MRGCRQRAPWPGQALPSLPRAHPGHQPCESLREPCREGRQKSLSWIQPGSSEAAVLGLPSQGKVLGEGGWRLLRTPNPRATSLPPRSRRRSSSGPQIGTSRLAGVHRDGEWEKPPLSSARQSGMAGSRRKSGDFQRTKRLLAASIAGGGEGESPAPAPAGVEEKHKKHRVFVFYLPGNPGSITGMAHRGGPAKPCCCGETESWGAGTAASHRHGVVFGECHCGVTGWARTRGTAGHSPCPGSAERMSLL